MKFKIPIQPILLFITLTAFTSCNGQNTTTVAHRSATTIGDTVSAMDTSIWYVFQDRNNNFWFGSNGQGAYRYDGKTTIHYSIKDGLCNGQVRGIQEDSSGNIYFNTAGGVSKFDGKAFTTLGITKSDLHNGGWKLQSGDLWFQGAQDSGVVYRYDGAALHRLELPKTKAGEDFIAAHPRSKYPHINFSPYDVYCIYKDRKGNMWFGTNVGLCRYDGKAFAWLSEEELGIGDIAYHVRSVFEDKDGAYWFSNTMQRFYIQPTGNDNTHISYRKENGIVSSKDHDMAYFMSCAEDNNDDLWMVTYNKGLWRYDGKTLTRYDIKNGNENVLLFTVYKDRQGGLWLGTHNGGAYKFNGRTFEQFRL